MANTGEIRLVTQNENVIHEQPYYSYTDRRRIIELWEKLCGPRFTECAIHICPNTNELIKKDGTNLKAGNYQKNKLR